MKGVGMNRLLCKARRYCVRLWWLNRNQTIAKSDKILRLALRTRRSIIMGVPEDRREEVVSNDAVLRNAREMVRGLTSYFKELGVSL